ncbi:uridine kinase [Pengzhenrongella sp.]|uniref:uridine kinase n=1 Tax=Pengzhenrongella sp. TaxID=2888820 RepID=UPI002F95885D
MNADRGHSTPAPAGGFEEIVAQLLAGVPRQGRTLVAIDGVRASGKSTFAAQRAHRIDTRPLIRLARDDFFNPAAIRHARADSPRRASGSTRTTLRASGDGLDRPASYDRASGETVEPEQVQASPDARVLVEGTFLHRDQLAPLWDYSIFLDVPFQETAWRMAQRDGLEPENLLLDRYTGGQRLYFASAAPWDRASLVIDVHRPKIINASAASPAP